MLAFSVERILVISDCTGLYIYLYVSMSSGIIHHTFSATVSMSTLYQNRKYQV